MPQTGPTQLTVGDDLVNGAGNVANVFSEPFPSFSEKTTSIIDKAGDRTITLILDSLPLQLPFELKRAAASELYKAYYSIKQDFVVLCTPFPLEFLNRLYHYFPTLCFVYYVYYIKHFLS